MGRKRNGRQTANRQREVTSDQTELKAQLEQQSQLVEQLTQQLNDAHQRLEQSDSRSANSALANHDSARILECLRTLLKAHEDLQPQRTLQRIEDKIDDLREREVARPAATEQVSASHDLTRDDDDTLSWEQIRANVVSGAKPDSKTEPIAEETNEFEARSPSLSGVLAPDPIDLDQADIQTLREAVERRDAYAVCLLHQMRVVERRKLINADELAKVQGVPAEMEAVLADLDARLQDVLRVAEVELSMERARISRESVRLEHKQNLLARQEERLNEQRASLQLPPKSPKKSNRKWLAALGFAKD